MNWNGWSQMDPLVILHVFLTTEELQLPPKRFTILLLDTARLLVIHQRFEEFFEIFRKRVETFGECDGDTTKRRGRPRKQSDLRDREKEGEKIEIGPELIHLRKVMSQHLRKSKGMEGKLHPVAVCRLLLKVRQTIDLKNIVQNIGTHLYHLLEIMSRLIDSIVHARRRLRSPFLNQDISALLTQRSLYFWTHGPGCRLPEKIAFDLVTSKDSATGCLVDLIFKLSGRNPSETTRQRCCELVDSELESLMLTPGVVFGMNFDESGCLRQLLDMMANNPVELGDFIRQRRAYFASRIMNLHEQEVGVFQLPLDDNRFHHDPFQLQQQLPCFALRYHKVQELLQTEEKGDLCIILLSLLWLRESRFTLTPGVVEDDRVTCLSFPVNFAYNPVSHHYVFFRQGEQYCIGLMKSPAGCYENHLSDFCDIRRPEVVYTEPQIADVPFLPVLQPQPKAKKRRTRKFTTPFARAVQRQRRRELKQRDSHLDEFFNELTNFKPCGTTESMDYLSDFQEPLPNTSSNSIQQDDSPEPWITNRFPSDEYPTDSLDFDFDFDFQNLI